MPTQIFGVRHHGPGSARRLIRALAAMQPDTILVEGPADAEKLIKDIAHPELVPPVAMLLYNPKSLTQASYYPFAEFSPEWQAIKYGLANEIPLHFMDLPQGISFARSDEAAEKQQLEIPQTVEEIAPEDQALQRDPMGYLARLAGYTDSERWWEVTFEEQFEDTEIFPELLQLITALREETKASTKEETLLREAYMRKTMRDVIKKGAKNIAVVCGAWHAPALVNLDEYKASNDNKLLKGRKKIKIAATWIPWTYQRLAFQSGYGAGVTSPAWYQLLFQSPNEAVIRWMSTLAQLFRSEDMDASSAHVIEAVRLAETLATVRRLKIPGIEELREAAVAIFCGGDTAQLNLVADRLAVGSQIGQVPDSIPKIPLQVDLEKAISTARLKKFWENPEELEKELDLRKASQLKTSQLLHRMNILNIPFGKLRKSTKGDSAGAFSEPWKLQWKPEFVLQIIEAGMWGNTVSIAATNKVTNQMESLTILSELTQLIESAFNADLVDVFNPLIQKINTAAVTTRDVTQLMDALPPLVSAIRYGNTRGLNTDALLNLIRQLIPRIAIALPTNATNLDQESSEALFKKITAVNRSVFVINEQPLIDEWLRALGQVMEDNRVNGILRGACCRILFDKDIIDMDTVATRMHFTLSPAHNREASAAWLEGFCYGSGLLIIHNNRLWNILNDWVSAIPMDAFMNLLPLLRRTFASFSQPERQKMMGLAKKGRVEEVAVVADGVKLDEARAGMVEETLRLLLG